MKKYNHIVVAGTFDHLHKGHKSLVDIAFRRGKRVTIGLVKAPFGKRKKLADGIQNYQARRKALYDYLKEKGLENRVKFYPISDIYGNAAVDHTIDALVVTRETYDNGKKINALRAKNQKKIVKLIIGPLIKSKDQKIIRSERIRRGEIDERGKVYFEVFRARRKLILPPRLKSLLRIPLGRVIRGVKGLPAGRQGLKGDWGNWGDRMIITIGDIITSEMIKIGIEPDVQIVDFRAMRRPVSLPEIKIQKSARKVINRAGTIGIGGIRVIREVYRDYLDKGKRGQVVVRGEEDLLALPAILLAPLGAVVLYGQWDLRGAILVKVTEEMKEKIRKIIQKFKRI